MKVFYDRSVDAAYIAVVEAIAPGEVSKTYLCDPLAVDGQIHLDFDSEGRLLGIEILGARRFLPPSLLAEAEPPKGK